MNIETQCAEALARVRVFVDRQARRHSNRIRSAHGRSMLDMNDRHGILQVVYVNMPAISRAGFRELMYWEEAEGIHESMPPSYRKAVSQSRYVRERMALYQRNKK